MSAAEPTTAPPCTLRVVTPNDAPTLTGLVERIAAESSTLLYAPGERLDVAAMQAMLRHQGRDGRGIAWIAESRDPVPMPVGFAMLAGGLSLAKRGVVGLAVGVAAAYQRRGIGAALVTAAQDWARATPGVWRLELTTLTTNHAARALYERAGFQLEGNKRGVMVVDGALADESALAWFPPDRDGPTAPALSAAGPAIPNEAGIRFRPIDGQDAAAYLAFAAKVRAETPFLSTTTAESAPNLAMVEQLIARGLALPGVIGWIVATAGDEIIGDIGLSAGRFQRSAHEATIAMAVTRAQWGRGIGRRLLAAGEEWARITRKRRLALEVMAHNTRALQLYQRAGFRLEVEAPRSFKLTDGYLTGLRMAKAIDLAP